MRTYIRRDAPALAQDRREDGRKQTSVFACEAWSFALVRRPKHNEVPHVQPCTEARIPRRGYPYLNRLPIFMTQARAPTLQNHPFSTICRDKLLSTASAPAQVTHRGEGQIRYEAFRTVHATGIALREEFRRPPTAPRHAFRKITHVCETCHELQKKVFQCAVFQNTWNNEIPVHLCGCNLQPAS